MEPDQQGNIPADKLDEAVKKFENLMDSRIKAAVKASEDAADAKLKEQVIAILDTQKERFGIGRADVLDIFASCKDELKIELGKQAEKPIVKWAPSKKNPEIFETVGGINALYRKFGYYTAKGIDENVDVVGAPTDPGRLWTPRTGGNPFRPYVTVQQIMGDTFIIVRLNELVFRERGTRKVALPDDGESAETQIPVKNYELQTALTLASDEDVPQYAPTIELAVIRADSKLKGGIIFAVIKASGTGNGGFGLVKTGVANKLPPKDQIINVASAMIEQIGTDYRDMAVFQCSRGFEAVLQQAAQSANAANYAFNPALGVRMLHGYPLIVNDRFDTGNAANDVSASFGDLEAGITMGERVDLQITSNPFTEPGSITYHARSRCEAAVNDTGAVVVLQTKA